MPLLATITHKLFSGQRRPRRAPEQSDVRKTQADERRAAEIDQQESGEKSTTRQNHGFKAVDLSAVEYFHNPHRLPSPPYPSKKKMALDNPRHHAPATHRKLNNVPERFGNTPRHTLLYSEFPWAYAFSHACVLPMRSPGLDNTTKRSSDMAQPFVSKHASPPPSARPVVVHHSSCSRRVPVRVR